VPVLPPEINLFPDNLLAEPAAMKVGDRCWWVLHTKPRQEKSIARRLVTDALPFYLPLVAQRKKTRDRVICSQIPLFPGYVFLFGTRIERTHSLTTNRIANILKVAQQEDMWRDLTQVQRLIDTGAPIRPEGRLVAGTPVEITSGPLAGLKGTILKDGSRRRFLVQVDFLHQGASVLLDDFYLTPIGVAPQTSSTR
jgi:transcriptional antiterminator RfaH